MEPEKQNHFKMEPINLIFIGDGARKTKSLRDAQKQ